MQSVDVCRPLGAGEQIFWFHDQAHPLHFALTAQIKGKFTVPQLQQALHLVQQRHPLLRVRIALDEAEHPWFVEHPADIPLRVVERQSEQHWQREVEREITTPFVWSQAPLMRVVLVHSSNGAELSELLVTCHHSIADGISVTYLVQDILQVIATPTAFGQSLPVPPSLEDLIVEHPPKRVSLLKPIPKFMSNSFPIEQRARQSNRSFVSSSSLSPETTMLLISRCRQEQTSVHAAICAAFLLAVRQQNHSEQPQNINCSSPINLRPYLTSANQEDVSFCIAAARTLHFLSSDANFWEVARSVKRQLKQSMNSNNLFEKIFQTQEWLFTHPSPDDALQAFKDQLDYDIAVSNLTRLTITQQFGELELQAIYGPVVTTGVKNDRLVGVATLGNRLFFTLVCSERVMLRAQAKILQEKAIHLLNEVITSANADGQEMHRDGNVYKLSQRQELSEDSLSSNHFCDTTCRGEDLMTFTHSYSSEEADKDLTKVLTVRPDTKTLTRQRLNYFIGISETTVGAKGISMNLVIIPPGGSAEPHFHRDYETAIYLVKGRVETRYGQGLKQSVVNEAGDFIFIPPGVPHQPHNLDATEPAHAIVARNDPNEQEHVILYNPVLEK